MNDALREKEKRQERIADLDFAYGMQPQTPISRCNLCGAQHFVVLTHRDRYDFPAQANLCATCGLVFLNPVMTAEAYRDFYTVMYRPLVSAYHGRRIDAETIQEEQQQYAAERARFLDPFLSSSSADTLLDIGGSTGVVAHYLAERCGLRATVLDPAPLEIAQAQRLGLETIVGLLEDYEPAGRKFDLITLCQTVDHLLDIKKALRKIRHLLNESGLFFVDIVDFRAAYLRNWSVEEAIKIDHPFYLTEPTLEAYLQRAGFEVIRKEYATDHLHIGHLCRVTSPYPDYLPAPHTVENLLREIRTVQNWPPGVLLL